MTHKIFASTITILSLALGLVIFVTDGFGIPFVRFHVADIVIVIFLYGLLSFSKNSPHMKALFVLTFAFAIEALQLIYNPTGQSTLGELTIGSTFDPIDIAMYATGAIIAFSIDSLNRKSTSYETKN